MKTLSFKIEDELHHGLKVGAAMEGRSITGILEELIRTWVMGRDPFVHQLKTMPVTPDGESLSPDDLAAIKEARKEKNAGPWEDLARELPSRRRK